MVRWAVVWPVSISAHLARSMTAHVRPASVSRYAAVKPVMPAPTTATSTFSSRSSLANRGIGAESCQYDVVSTSVFMGASTGCLESTQADKGHKDETGLSLASSL